MHEQFAFRTDFFKDMLANGITPVEMATQRYRRSGRTTRMIEEIVKVHRSHERICVVFPIAAHVRYWMGKVAAGIKLASYEVSVNAKQARVNNIHFISSYSPSWDWDSLRVIGGSEETLVFIDHSAIEHYLRKDARVSKLLDLQHQYDLLLTEAQ